MRHFWTLTCLMILSVVFLLIVVSCGIFWKNSKLLNLLLIVTLYILFAFEHSDQDYMTYVDVYDSVGAGNLFWGYEASFILFCNVGNSYGLTFDAARAILCVVEVLALASTVNVFSNKIAFVFALLLIFPAIAVAELFRWLCGMCITIYAFPYLIRSGNIGDYIIYAVLITIASLVHTSCIFFYIFFLLSIRRKKVLLTIVFVTFTILVVTSQMGFLYSFLKILPIDDHIAEKMDASGQSNIWGVISLAIRECFIFLMGYLVYYKQKDIQYRKPRMKGLFIFNRFKYGQKSMGELLISKIWDINIISIILIGLAIYTPQVQRLFHVLLFYNIVAVAYMSGYRKYRNLKFSAFMCCVLTLILHLSNGSQNIDIAISHFREGFLVNMFNMIGFY